METMHAAGRRNLPPVPRPAADVAVIAVPASTSDESALERTMELLPRTAEEAPVDEPSGDEPTGDEPTDDLLDPERLAVADEPELALDDDDPAQDFVSRLRAAAADFASAAGADTAVVREAVPPARHRRSRCRVVLLYADGTEADVTFLGPVSSSTSAKEITMSQFDTAIQLWLGAGQERSRRWLVPDDDAADGVAVDVTAWLDR